MMEVSGDSRYFSRPAYRHSLGPGLQISRSPPADYSCSFLRSLHAFLQQAFTGHSCHCRLSPCSRSGYFSRTGYSFCKPDFHRLRAGLPKRSFLQAKAVQRFASFCRSSELWVSRLFSIWKEGCLSGPFPPWIRCWLLTA